mmetsp:Transcript_26901/g.62910  ORF Transcript_26901/g.62910 Transcript_26901/m.62910 type:complete len:138 (+) Transcript_26901:115-528(+)
MPRRLSVSTTSSLLFVVLVTSSNSLTAADTRIHRRDEVTGHIPSTHEEIVSRREEHHDIFSSRLEEVNAQLHLHESGEKLLTEKEYHRLNRKKTAYENKVEELSRQFDERHSGRIIFREELLNDLTKARIARSRGEL